MSGHLMIMCKLYAHRQNWAGNEYLINGLLDLQPSLLFNNDDTKPEEVTTVCHLRAPHYNTEERFSAQHTGLMPRTSVACG